MIQQADVSDRQAVRKMFAAGVEAFGRVDILINSAGEEIAASWTLLTTCGTTYDSHLKGHFICGQEYVRANPDREGYYQYGRCCGVNR